MKIILTDKRDVFKSNIDLECDINEKELDDWAEFAQKKDLILIIEPSY